MSFSSTVVTRGIVCKSEREYIMSVFDYSVLMFFKCFIFLIVGVCMPVSRNRLLPFSSTFVTCVIVCKSEKECILSEFNYSVLVFLSGFFFSLQVCGCPFPVTDCCRFSPPS